MSKKTEGRVPTEAGYYWAKTAIVEEENFEDAQWEIVEMCGMAPFLTVYPISDTDAVNMEEIKILWGPRIEEPEE